MRDLRWNLWARGRGFTWIEIFAVGLTLGVLSAWVWIAISPHLHHARPPAVAGPRPGAAPGANRDPNELLFQARIMPKFENGRMIGVAVNAIKPGSLLQRIGIRDGDVITQLNGVTFDSPAEGARIVKEFANAERFHVVVRGPNGAEQVHDFTR